MLTGEKREILIRRPSSLSPWSEHAGISSKNGSVWISMKPRKILDQFSKGVGDIATTELPEEFLFLAPLSLNENIVHHWEAYESVASRIAQKVRSAVKLGAEGSALLKSSTSVNSGEIQKLFSDKGGDVGVSIENFVKYAYGKVAASTIPKIKVDTPLYYTNSDRRQLVLEFQLYHENLRINPEDVLIKPIQKLMKYSSPNLHKGGLSIDFPYMWEVKTVPYEFINYTTCALVGVQPTWNSPYIEGVPVSCNLQLTFQDMSPLYRDTIESGSVIRVISKEQAESQRAKGILPTTTDQIKKAKELVQSKFAGQNKPIMAKIPSTPANN